MCLCVQIWPDLRYDSEKEDFWQKLHILLDLISSTEMVTCLLDHRWGDAIKITSHTFCPLAPRRPADPGPPASPGPPCRKTKRVRAGRAELKPAFLECITKKMVWKWPPVTAASPHNACRSVYSCWLLRPPGLSPLYLDRIDQRWTVREVTVIGFMCAAVFDLFVTDFMSARPAASK